MTVTPGSTCSWIGRLMRNQHALGMHLESCAASESSHGVAVRMLGTRTMHILKRKGMSTVHGRQAP